MCIRDRIKDGPNDAGDMFERPGRPSDYFPWNFPNEQAARAALGAVPPDTSLLAKARSYERGFPQFLFDPFIQYQEQGPDYIDALLNGYTNDKDPNWNEFMPGHKIAMPNPLSDGAVDYEMAGKDLIESVKLSGAIVRALGGSPPEGFNYELFLDEKGQKISKSKGNGLTIEEWLTYASPESLSLFMYQKPTAAKRRCV